MKPPRKAPWLQSIDPGWQIRNLILDNFDPEVAQALLKVREKHAIYAEQMAQWHDEPLGPDPVLVDTLCVITDEPFRRAWL